MRVIKKISIEDPLLLKDRLLDWSRQHEEIVWLDSNSQENKNPLYSSFDAVLAVEAITSIKTDTFQAFDKLEGYRSVTNDWIFGYLTYDLKNDVEKLTSANSDFLEFPDLFFFQPKKILFLKGNILEMHYLKMVDDEMDEDITQIFNSCPQASEYTKPHIHLRTSKDNYLHKVSRMLEYIQKGDIYEANFCQEFYAENMEMNPSETFKKLNAISGAPFSVYLKLEDKFLLSASPERYLRKEGNKVISQPIKGTMKRSANAEEDKKLAHELQNDQKEWSENIMITDLVRNDLSKTASQGSVNVEELCGLYTFKQVHQLITTITSNVSESTKPTEILKTTYPMGSMTGAPKVRAMQIIEELEDAKRGLYSGTVGYFTPDGDFDFNVIIRSILYNAGNNYVSFSVGSAITSKSIPEKEYEECLLKAKAMRQVLEGN